VLASSAGSNGGPVLIKLQDDHQVALTAFDELKQNHPHRMEEGQGEEGSPAPNKTLNPIRWRANGPKKLEAQNYRAGRKT